MQQVEGFQSGNEFAFQEGLAHRGVHHKVIRVEHGRAIAAAAVHGSVGREGGFQYGKGISCRESVLVIQCIEGLEVTHPPFAVSPGNISRGTDVEVALLELDVSAIMQNGGINCIFKTFYWDKFKP